MKSFLIAISFLFAAVSATAGGLSNPIVPADPYEPPSASVPFDGFYAGGQVNNTEATSSYSIERERIEVTEWEEHTSTDYVYECAAGTSNSQHNNNKCVVDEYVWNHSPELTALSIDNSPWGQYGQQYRYDIGYHGVWLGGAEALTFTSDREMGETSTVKPTTVTLIDTIENYTTFSSEEVISYTESGERKTNTTDLGVHVGYQRNLNGFVVGGELTADRTLLTAELNAGVAVRQTLFYGFGGVGQFTDADGETWDGNVVGGGITYQINDAWTTGFKTTVGEFDGDNETITSGLRVSFNF